MHKPSIKIDMTLKPAQIRQLNKLNEQLVRLEEKANAQGTTVDELLFDFEHFNFPMAPEKPEALDDLSAKRLKQLNGLKSKKVGK